MRFWNLRRIFRFGKKGQANAQEPHPKATSEIIRISDEMELTVQGIPSDLSQEQRTKVLASLVRNALATIPERTYRIFTKEKLACASLISPITSNPQSTPLACSQH